MQYSRLRQPESVVRAVVLVAQRTDMVLERVKCAELGA
jgi:hypothetical protein